LSPKKRCGDRGGRQNNPGPGAEVVQAGLLVSEPTHRLIEREFVCMAFVVIL
jgi:hypothetical protein